MNKKLDILAFAAHPDDVELSCAGTLISHKKMGYRTGVVDLTQGELATRGTPETRLQEANDAARIMDLDVRDNLKFDDGWFDVDRRHQIEIIKRVRRYQPEIVFANAVYDRHPDHMRAARLVEEALFKSGLSKVETEDDGKVQQPWRPGKLYHYIQSVSLEPNFFVDISDAHDQKMEAVKAYKTQFYDPNSDEPDTYISSPAFMQMLISRAQEYGHRIGVKYAEGFIQNQFVGVKNLFELV